MSLCFSSSPFEEHFLRPGRGDFHPLSKNSVCSRSWRACAPPPPGGALPAVTAGLYLSRRQLRRRKVRSSNTPIPNGSLRKSNSSMWCRQLAVGRTDPDRPLTARPSAALGIQVRPGAARDRFLPHDGFRNKCLSGLHHKSARQFYFWKQEV